MTLEELEILLATHGARRERWPAGMGAAVDVLCASLGPAAEMMGHAQALDRMLDEYQTTPPSAVLRAAVLAAVADKDSSAEILPFPGPRRGYSLMRALLPQAAALVAATFVGVWIGVNAYTLPMFGDEDYSSYVLGDSGDLVASLAGGQP